MKKLSKVNGMPIYSIEEGKHIGQVKDFLFQISTGVIQGWTIKSQHFFSKRGGVPATKIVTLGEDIIVIKKVFHSFKMFSNFK